MSFVPNPAVTAKRLSERENGSTEIEQLVCARCQPLEARVAEVEAERFDLIRENTEQGNEIAGLQHTLRKQGAEIMALRRELTQVREDDPKSEVIRSILDHWSRTTGRTSRKGRKADISVSGSRGQMVKKALRMQNVHTRRAYTPEELCLALTGLALKPYVGRGRQATDDHGAKRFDEVKHALNEDELIDRFIGYAEAASEAAEIKLEAMAKLFLRKDAEAATLANIVLDAAIRREQEQGLEPSAETVVELERADKIIDLIGEAA